MGRGREERCPRRRGKGRPVPQSVCLSQREPRGLGGEALSAAAGTQPGLGAWETLLPGGREERVVLVSTEASD